MGVKGGWDLLNLTSSVSFIDWASETISTGTVHELVPCIGIDASPHHPAYKHKKTVKKTPVWLTNDFKWLLKGFGFPYWEVPGEAEAELVMLSCLGQISTMMSEDFDTMIFGARQVIQIKEERDSKYLIKVYEAGSQFSCNNLVMIVLLTGGDYDHQDFSMTLETQGAWQHSLASCIPLDFPQVSVLIQYLHPVTSQLNGPNNVPAAPLLNQPNISHLSDLCSEIYVSFILPGEILTQITSAIDGTYNTNTTAAEYDQFVKKPEIHAWLSRVLTLHAWPNTLDDIQHPTLNTGRNHKMVKPSIKKMRHIEAEPSISQPPQLLPIYATDLTQS
ncbi:hypothetical protein ARMGADRAFT_1034119 [Armillaria gallica]|uniref:XPG-I domain-containing protein n=1 Tax=Armillaria gallica TaxID=47427 RepID=A0A2H3D248_ARMGA|nr:hypothetical protein ARMGADRAFT_1034119 [Armillaria gallica]